MPNGISQVVEQSFWYRRPYVRIHMSSFVIFIYVNIVLLVLRNSLAVVSRFRGGGGAYLIFTGGPGVQPLPSFLLEMYGFGKYVHLGCFY